MGNILEAAILGGRYLTRDKRVSNFTEKELYRGANWAIKLTLPKVKQDLIHLLQALRDDVGAAVDITSGVRSKAANAKAGGDPTSEHLKGGAADGKVRGIVGWQLVPYLERATVGGTLGRWGVYHVAVGGHFHLDCNTTKARRRFVGMPIFDERGRIRCQYQDLETWAARWFPGVELSKISPIEANRVLGF